MAAQVGRGLRGVGRGGETRLAAPRWGTRSSRSSAGPSAAATTAAASATACRGSTSPGAPGPGSSSRSPAGSGRLREAGRLTLLFRHRVDALTVTGGAVDGVAAPCSSRATRRAASPSSRTAPASSSSARRRSSSPPAASAATTTWSARPGRNGSARRPRHMLSGVPAHVDGRMLGIAETRRRPRVINGDRMWHYIEGIANWNPVWPMHGIRILPGPSSLWLDATGKRLPVPLYPGFDTLGTLEYLRGTGYDHSWFILTRKIIAQGVRAVRLRAEPRPDRQGPAAACSASRSAAGVPGPVQAFLTTARTSSSRADPRRAGRGDERADRRAPLLDAAPIELARSIGARPRDATPAVRQGLPDRPRSGGPAPTSATG